MPVSTAIVHSDSNLDTPQFRMQGCCRRSDPHHCGSAAWIPINPSVASVLRSFGQDHCIAEVHLSISYIHISTLHKPPFSRFPSPCFMVSWPNFGAYIFGQPQNSHLPHDPKWFSVSAFPHGHGQTPIQQLCRLSRPGLLLLCELQLIEHPGAQDWGKLHPSQLQKMYEWCNGVLMGLNENFP